MLGFTPDRSTQLPVTLIMRSGALIEEVVLVNVEPLMKTVVFEKDQLVDFSVHGGPAVIYINGGYHTAPTAAEPMLPVSV